MPTPRISVDPAILLAALDRHAGNKSAMAAELGLHRQTIVKLLTEYGISDKPMQGGRVRVQAVNIRALPKKGEIYRYLLTSAQNNTKAFSALLDNLKAYQAWFPVAEIMISRFTYNKTAYENSTYAKPGRGPTESDFDQCWYDPAIRPYVCDDPATHGSARYQLAPDLQWCAEVNVWPTATTPLSGFESYAGSNSAIYPHAKIAMRSMPRMKGSPARFLFTTGCVTQLNYIQRKAGQKAEHHHVHGALIVEVNSDGDWWVRQINADRKGSFYDCPNGQIVKVESGKVSVGHRSEAISWGDVHASEIDQTVKMTNWAPGSGAVDKLKPRYQFMHDLFSMRSRSHHEMKVFSKMYEKFIKGEDSVSKEVRETKDVLVFAQRDFCKTVIISSNHDRHGDKWLDEADYKADLPNAEFFLRAQLDRVLAIKRGSPWDFLQWAVLRLPDCPPVHFAALDESFLIGPKGHQIECGLHGDLGPNGSRGSTKALTVIGLRTTKGHDHSATILDGVYSAGVCQLNLSYNHGPSSWSLSHVLTYLNGKRAILTQRADRLWA